MVQDQLVEYVSSQIKLGISRDAIKSALVGVGWAPLDVEDTLKKVEGGTVSAPAQPAAPQKTMDAIQGAAVSPKLVSFSMPGTAAGQVKNPEPQSIRMSDLVSSIAPASSMPASVAPKVVPSGNPVAGKITPVAKDQFPAFVSPAGKKKSRFGLLGIVAVILIIVIGALAGYLFVKNNSLTSELQAAQAGAGQQSQATAQSVTAQVQALDASNTALTAQVTSLAAENQDLSTNLLLLAVPAGSPTATTSEPVSITGTLSAGLGKNTYIVTTQYGVKASVKNSSVAAVAAVLQPLLGSSVQISGTYIPGTPSITVTDVNGSPVFPPIPVAATSTSAPASTSAATNIPPSATTTP